jgi:hypothetical protein
MRILLAFARRELARWLSKPEIMRSRGAPGPMSGAVVQKEAQGMNNSASIQM